jgi:hypothetical protein
MRKLLVVCVCLLVSSTGCRKLVRKAVQKATSDDHAGQAMPAAAKQDTPAEKSVEAAMSKYAEGFNKLISPMKYMIEDYERAVPDVKQPPARKPVLNLGSTDRDLDEVEKHFAQAKQATPPSHADLGKTADETMAAARAVRKVFTEAVRYYGAENYKDDKGEGGKDIDTRMNAGVDAYHAAVGKLQERLSEIELETMEKELKQVPETKPGYHFRAFNLAAKRLVELRSKPEKLDAALETVRAAHGKLKQYAEGRPDVLAAFKNYVGMADQFEAQATAFVREAKEPAKGKKGPSQNTSLLVTRYNNLVQLGNALYELEGSGVLK